MHIQVVIMYNNNCMAYFSFFWQLLQIGGVHVLIHMGKIPDNLVRVSFHNFSSSLSCIKLVNNYVLFYA